MCPPKAHIVLSYLPEDGSVPRYPQRTLPWICSSCREEAWQDLSCLHKVKSTSVRTDPWLMFQSQQREAIDLTDQRQDHCGYGTCWRLSVCPFLTIQTKNTTKCVYLLSMSDVTANPKGRAIFGRIVQYSTENLKISDQVLFDYRQWRQRTMFPTRQDLWFHFHTRRRIHNKSISWTLCCVA